MLSEFAQDLNGTAAERAAAEDGAAALDAKDAGH
jgi:hypothetical protein